MHLERFIHNLFRLFVVSRFKKIVGQHHKLVGIKINRFAKELHLLVFLNQIRYVNVFVVVHFLYLVKIHFSCEIQSVQGVGTGNPFRSAFPGIAQGHGPVENKLPGVRVLVHVEVADALELKYFHWFSIFETGFHLAALFHDQ